MKNNSMQLTHIAAAVAMALVSMTTLAQQATDAPAPVPTEQVNKLNLDQVVVTGTPTRTSKMKSSSALSTLDEDQIQLAAPTSAADLFRSIPGFHSEASGGEGNANITVRGIPISAGGSRYVGFQEDGVPVLLNGDYAFVTPDMFMRVDGTMDHVEAVRGGSAGILASNSPAGIINFITKTGTTEGGSVGVSRGLGFNQSRLDFDYGHHISDTTRFFIGGSYRYGDGVRDSNTPMEIGGQIKGNITQELGGGSFIRLSFKHLDDQAPSDMPVAYTLSNANPTKANPATVGSYPGIDPLKYSYYSPYWPSITMRGANNQLSTTNINSGLTVKENNVGLTGSFNLGDGWKLDDSFKYASKGGSFLAGYPTGNPFTAVAGTTYAAGPNKGSAYTGLVTEVSAFDANFDNLNSTFNGMKLSKTFDFADKSKLTTLFGWDLNSQTIGVTQNLPHYLMTSGSNPIPVSGSNASGVLTDATGLLPDLSNWSEQTRNVRYTMDSPYVSLGYESGQLNLDGGIRQDRENASGCQSSTTSVAAGTFTPGLFPTACQQPVNYNVSHTSYSAGIDYRLTTDLAFFAHYSSGVSFNVVERMGGPFDGTAPIPLNTVKQLEAGVKYRSGGFSTFVTFFNAKTDESNYDVTLRQLTANSYKSNGVEIESAYHTGGFSISGGLTYVDPSITATNETQADGSSVVGDLPKRMAKYTYQISPSYTVGDFMIGGSLVGTGKSYGDDQNTIILPAFAQVNMFSSYQFNSHAQVWLSANNLFNKVGFTEYDGGQGARSINARTVKAGLKYSF